MKTFIGTFVFFVGFSLILWGVQQIQQARYAQATEHVQTFNERAGAMFDHAEFPDGHKGDRLEALPELKGGALIGGSAVNTVIFRTRQDGGVQR